MPNRVSIGTPIAIGIAERVEDGYFEGITIGFAIGININVVVDAHTAIRIAEDIIAKSAQVLSQSAAPCGCDAKTDWICERHDVATEPPNIANES